MQDLEQFLVAPEKTLRQAMQAIDANAKGIVLVVDEARQLLGVLTDGDIRRALLAGATLDSPLRAWANHNPITVSAASHTQDVAAMMGSRRLRQLPIVDDTGRVVDLRFAGEPALAPTLPVQTVIMAGGMGERLRPLTETTPKPLLRVGSRPILEIIVSLLHEWGIRNVWMALNYKADMIESYFQDGAQWDMSIRYIREPKPLGTIGALSLIADETTQPTLVINGDILTQLDFRGMYRFHGDAGSVMTVGVRRYDLQVPFGVLDTESTRVTRLSEKPVLEFSVNAGIYLLEPEAVRYIPRETRFDATDLIAALLAAHRQVRAYGVHEYWLDIGQLPDYERANQDARTLSFGRGEA